MNKNFIKLTTIPILSLLILISIRSYVFAGIGVSPGEVSQDNLRAGIVFNKEITISQSDANEDAKITVEPDLGEMSSWITFDPGREFIIKKGINKYPLILKIQVPADAQKKEYSGSLKITSTPVTSTTGLTLISGARVDITFKVTDAEIVDLLVRSYNVGNSLFQEPIPISFTIENRGNIAVAPSSAKLEILGSDGNIKQVLEEDTLEQVKPSETKEYSIKLLSAIDAGDYRARFKILYRDQTLIEENVEFRVLPKLEVNENTNSTNNIINGRLLLFIILPILIGLVCVIIYLLILDKVNLMEIHKKKKIIIGLVVAWIVLSITAMVVLGLNNNANIKGLSTEDPQIEGTRGRIFADPNISSELIGTFSEINNIGLLEKDGDWYKVIVDNEKVGWAYMINFKE